MIRILWTLVAATFLFSCSEREKSHRFSSVRVANVYEDSVSIRAIEFLDPHTLAFAGSKGTYGTVDLATHTVRSNVLKYDTIIPQFRAVGHTKTDFFMLSISSPALLYKTGNGGQMELVYKEEGEGVFYDSLKFWNDREGMAVGDSVNGCLSILVTRDGGNTWHKVPCSQLPSGVEGEGAFAASNTNIGIYGDNAWVATTSGRVFHSPDKGKTWTALETPIVKGAPAQGIYSLDFFDAHLGFAVGGDYTRPEANSANKMVTTDGGASWQLMADGEEPGYKSCVQFVPNAGGADLVAVGFTGISYSDSGGTHWKALSDEGFYTLRFLNDSVAYAAGRNRIAKLIFE